MKHIIILCGYIPQGKRADMYFPEATLCPEQVVDHAKELLRSPVIKQVIHTQSDHFINVVRHYKYSNQDIIVKIKYFNKEGKKSIIHVDEKGMFAPEEGEYNSFPHGFFDASIDLIFQLNSRK